MNAANESYFKPLENQHQLLHTCYKWWFQQASLIKQEKNEKNRNLEKLDD